VQFSRKPLSYVVALIDLQAGINGFLAEPTPNRKPFG